MKKILMIISLILLTGCSFSGQPSQVDEEKTAVRDVFAMDTYMNIRTYGENCEIAASEGASEIIRLEKLLDVTDENSYIWAINHADGAETTVDASVSEILEKSLEISSFTDGALDITLYPVLKEWGFTTGEYQIPAEEKLAELLENTGFKEVRINWENISVPENFQLDTGALAKGYTSDRLMEIFRENGIESAIVNLGGNVQTLGKKPDGELWNVGIVNPFDESENLGIISVEDKAVITSGNYERFFIGDDGKKYWHIIDPNDGFPADNGLVSVTVIGESGIICDALSTALFVSGTEKAVDLWRSGAYEFDMILVTDSGEIFFTEGIENSFDSVSEMPLEVLRK